MMRLRRALRRRLFLTSPPDRQQRRRTLAGHSKWANIKHKKERNDGLNSVAISRVARDVTSAARAARAAGAASRADLEADARFSAAVTNAKKASAPKKVIENAINKALGIGDHAEEEEITYEGVGPGGVSFIVETVTDNRRRTAPEMRTLFKKNGGEMGQSGSCSWAFRSQTRVEVDCKGEDAVEAVQILALGADGVEDVVDSNDEESSSTVVEIFVGGAFSPDATALAKELADNDFAVSAFQHIRIPTMKVDGGDEAQFQAFLDALEAAPDVTRWDHNREDQ